ncbi:hypothetical protein O3M35_005689 [Rhynocoris fuscipes]|uniref:Uncharacterized protein n=1 Tax=Rhynocoris fuscipes TaxID=488301 RepID=A0AAW1DLS2_9HEMI
MLLSFRYMMAAVTLLSILPMHCKCFYQLDLENRELRRIGGLLKQLNKGKKITDPDVTNELIIPNLKLPRKIILTPFHKLDHKHLYLDMNTELKYNPQLSKIVDDYTRLLATLQPRRSPYRERVPEIYN